MSEQLNKYYIQAMQCYNHRMIVGPPLMEFEVLAYEQIARAVTSMAEYNRRCIDNAIGEFPVKESQDDC